METTNRIADYRFGKVEVFFIEVKCVVRCRATHLHWVKALKLELQGARFCTTDKNRNRGRGCIAEKQPIQRLQ